MGLDGHTGSWEKMEVWLEGTEQKRGGKVRVEVGVGAAGSET